MNRIILPAVIVFMILCGAWFLSQEGSESAFARENEENEMESGKDRAYYEWLISRDPRTGKIPDGIRQREFAWSKTNASRQSGMMSALLNNTYAAVGPSRNGGRTRAIGFDVRNNGSTNRIVLAGGINGGIFRSEDGGINWVFVHPSEEIRSVSCFAQDTRPGFQDNWYAGTGEALGASAGNPNAFVFGFGVFKSTDNGKTWSKLQSTVGTSSQFAFDNSFDIVTNIAVHPTTGDVYVAGHQSMIRSQDGGGSWAFVLRGGLPATNVGGVSDILINPSGTRLFAAFSGRNPDRSIAGVWSSPTGDNSSWTRIAGGAENQPDSVPGWPAYDNTTNTAGDFQGGWGRIAFAITPNQSQLYILVENSKSVANNVPEANLYRGDLTQSPITWSDFSSNLVAKANGTDDVYFQAQEGYNLEIAVHPTQNNIVYVGGVHLFRSTDGFQTTTNNLFMGGTYKGNASSTYTDDEGVSHVDFHRIKFDPSNPNRMIVGSDGGLALTPDNTAVKPTWLMANINYQTAQYYAVGIDQTAGSRTFVGGCQDISTTFRDQSGLLGTLLPDSNDHYIIIGGDGGQAYFFKNGPSQPYLLASAQQGQIFRAPLFGTVSLNKIKPTGTGDGAFVTYYLLDEDNPNNLYFPVNDTLYRTTQSTTVDANSWTRMSGVDNVASGQIFSMASTKGPYTTNSMLLIGTSAGKIFRLKNPANTDPTTQPDDITPSTMAANSLVKAIAINPRNQDTVLAVVSNYNVQSIFWTGNATSASPTWQGVEGNLSLPSVRSCAVVATTSGVDYYVGTTIGLYSTNSISGNGTFWSRENGGNGMMNTAIVNSLAYRWKDNTLVVGTHGNGMFAAYIGNAINIPTGVTNPVRNDKNFIINAYPTITNSQITYQAGNMLNIRDIQVQVINLGGQVMYNQSAPYGSGSLNVGRLPSGAYILTITSSDRKYQFIRKFVKY